MYTLLMSILFGKSAHTFVLSFFFFSTFLQRVIMNSPVALVMCQRNVLRRFCIPGENYWGDGNTSFLKFRF